MLQMSSLVVWTRYVASCIPLTTSTHHTHSPHHTHSSPLPLLTTPTPLTTPHPLPFISHLLDSSCIQTANTVSFLLHLVCTHPQVQDRLHEEVVRTVGPDGPVTPAALQNMHYVKGCVKETLRQVTRPCIMMLCVTLPPILQVVSSSSC